MVLVLSTVVGEGIKSHATLVSLDCTYIQVLRHCFVAHCQAYLEIVLSAWIVWFVSFIWYFELQHLHLHLECCGLA